MKDLSYAGDAQAALDLMQTMVKAGVAPSNHTHNVLLSALKRSGYSSVAVGYARKLSMEAGPYDLPLYHTLLQILLASGGEGEARDVLKKLESAGLRPNERTLNILIKGFTACGSLTAALEVFNSFCAAGGIPEVLTYNILMDSFARRGQLLNAESIFSQLAVQNLQPDAFSYNALMRAAICAEQPRRALAYYRLMSMKGIQADAVSLTMCIDAHARLCRPLQGISRVRSIIAQQDNQLLDIHLAARILAACARSSNRPSQQDVAREHALWILERFSHMSIAQDGTILLPGVNRKPQHRKSQNATLALLAHPFAMRDFIRTVARAGDYKSACDVFQTSIRPRPVAAWKEMLKLCNSRGDAQLASQLLAELDDHEWRT